MTNCVPVCLHSHNVRSLRLLPNGRALLSGSADTSIGIWEVSADGSDLRLLKELRGHTNRVRCIRVNPEGSGFYSGSSDMTIRCWHIK